MATLSPYVFKQYFDDNGDPLASGTIEAKAAGTANDKNMYTTAAGDVATPNPLPLSAAGRVTFWLEQGAYDFTIKNSAGDTIDQELSVNGSSGAGDASLQTVDTIAELKALAAGSSDYVEMGGHTTVSDGGQGYFYWDASSVASDNGGTILLPDSAPGTGRWLRVYNNTIIPEWFGCLGDATDVTAKINTIIALMNTSTAPHLYLSRLYTVNVDGLTTITVNGASITGSSHSAGIKNTIVTGGTNTNIVVSGDNFTANGFRVEGVVVDDWNTSRTQGINLTGTDNTITNMFFYNLTSHNVVLSGAHRSVVNDNKFLVDTTFNISGAAANGNAHDFVRITSDVDGFTVNGNTMEWPGIDATSSESCGRWCVGVITGLNGVVNGNTMLKTGFGGVDLEPNNSAEVIDNIVISNNVIKGTGSTSQECILMTGPVGSFVSNVVVDGNSCKSTENGINVKDPADYVTINNNVVDTVNKSGISSTGTYITVTGNMLRNIAIDGTLGRGIFVSNAGATITGNTILYGAAAVSGSTGIYTQKSDTIISGNVIVGNGVMANGIFAGDSSTTTNLQIVNNTIDGFTSRGIQFKLKQEYNVSGNTLIAESTSGTVGLYIDDQILRGIINGNTFRSCGTGLEITSSNVSMGVETLYGAIYSGCTLNEEFTFSTIDYKSETGTFTASLTLTGADSGATATIDSIVDNGTTGTLFLSSISGTFDNNEVITDSSTGSATADGLLYDGPWGKNVRIDYSTDNGLRQRLNGSVTYKTDIGAQSWDWTQNSGDYSLQAGTSGTSSFVSMFAQDGDDTDKVGVHLYSMGTPNSTVNRSRGRFEMDPAASFLRLYTDNNGTGTAYPIIIGQGGTVQIGSSASDLVGFHDVTGVVQHASTGETTGYAAVGGTNVNSNDTFTGNVGSLAYTLNDVVKALKNNGLMDK